MENFNVNFEKMLEEVLKKNSPEVCLSGSCVLILVLLTSHGLTLGLEARGVGHG